MVRYDEPKMYHTSVAQQRHIWKILVRTRFASASERDRQRWPVDDRLPEEVRAAAMSYGALLSPFQSEHRCWESTARKKLLHRFGVVAPCELQTSLDSEFSGVFGPGRVSFGVVRYSEAHPTWGRHPVQLGVAFKFFRQDAYPANLLMLSQYAPREALSVPEAWAMPSRLWTSQMKQRIAEELCGLLRVPVSTAPTDPSLISFPSEDARIDVLGTLSAFQWATERLGAPRGLLPHRTTLLDACRLGPSQLDLAPRVPFAVDLSHEPEFIDHFANQEYLDLRQRLWCLTAAKPDRVLFARLFGRKFPSDTPREIGKLYLTDSFLVSRAGDERLRFAHSAVADPCGAVVNDQNSYATVAICPIRGVAPAGGLTS